ncbi:MAG: DUF1579 domain-containing protein [Candidatus Eremiobacteraeota bacterium]|nr:DUF1579 domain-containing protein [Candidatus Eremiobacteraeota bacterium]
MKIRPLPILWAILLVSGFVTTSVRFGTAAPPLPTCNAAEYRQFDFWVGNWIVTNRITHKFEGTNNITSELNRCVVAEHWTSGSQTGSSFNLYDAATKMWHQTWIDNYGSLLVLRGHLQNGEMTLSGSKARKDGKIAMHRITYTPRTDGTVRQHWISSIDGGKTWKDLFDGIYKHQSVRNNPAPLALAAQCTAPEYRQFDFWSGNWRVTDRKTRKFVGTNDIPHVQGNCAIEEHWTSRSRIRGMSFNTYDRSTKRWHQTWVDSTGGLLELDGSLKAGSMVLSQTSAGQNGKPQLQRITWTPESDGTVRQHWVVSSDNGKTWQDAFDGIYHRASGKR